MLSCDGINPCCSSYLDQDLKNWFVAAAELNGFLPFPEPSSSTPAEMSASSAEEERAEREVPCGSEEEASDMDQTEQQAPAGEPAPHRDAGEGSSDPVSSSSEEAAEAATAPSSSTPEPPTEGATSSSISDTGTTEEPMEQD